MKFKQLIAKYVTENLCLSQLPELALVGLEEGFESESLLILAGMNNNDNSFEINQYFERTLYELNIELPEKRKAALIYAEGIIDEIIEGKKDVIKGTYEIYNNAIGSYDFFSETIEYCYDSVGFAKAYGLYDNYYDLKDSDYRWDRKKSNEILMKEIRNELFEELKNWKVQLETVYNKT